MLGTHDTRVAPGARLRPPGRAATLLWTLVALISCATQVAHWTLVAHHVCAKHGELVHGAAGHAHDATAYGHGSSPAAADKLHSHHEHGEDAVERSGDSDDEHDHCAGFTDAAPPSAVGPSALTSNLVWRDVYRQPTDVVHVQRLFLRAPKTSPPVAS